MSIIRYMNKTKIKSILQKTGMMPFVLPVIKIFSTNVIFVFFNSLRYYLYNNFLTYIPSHLLRLLYLKGVLRIRVGKASFIHMSCRFEGGKISIGDNSVIGRACILIGNIVIKNNVSITAETYIFTSSHVINSPTFEGSYDEVVIEDYAWVGARAMILPGVNIGKGAVLGAASTATKNIPDYCIFAGAPAKKVGKRSEDINYTLIYSPFFQ